MSKKAKITTGVLIGIGAAVAIFLVIFFAIFNTANKIKLSDYINVEYSGVNKYATANISVNKEELYNAIVEDEKDSEIKDLTRQYVDELEAKTDVVDIANDQTFDIYFIQPESVTSNEKMSNYISKHINADKFTYKAENIKEGEEVDIFSFVTVDIKGISPDVTLKITNNSKDELFKTLEYEASKVSGLSNGEMITIKCISDIHTIADKGFVPASTETKIEINGLSTYINNPHSITSEWKNKSNADNIAMITSETADKTFRILYTATNNAEYLTQPNEETATDIELVETYFLTSKSEDEETSEESTQSGESAANTANVKHDGPNNILYAIYKANVSNGAKSEVLYFAIEYDDIYVAADGTVGSTTTDITKNYKVSSDKEKLIKENINTKEKTSYYEINKI